MAHASRGKRRDLSDVDGADDQGVTGSKLIMASCEIAHDLDRAAYAVEHELARAR